MTQRQNGSICAEEYVVKRGDSFYLIAHKLGVPLRDLLAANRDIHPARLMVGDVLCIPREEDDRPQSTPPAPAPDTGSGSTGNSTSNTATGGTGGSTGNSSNTGSTGNTTGSNTGNTGTGSSTGNTSSSAGNAGSGSAGTGTGAGSGSNAPEPVPSAPACSIEEQVSVRQGETIADIQLQSLLSRNTLESANPDVDLDALKAGQILCVPSENRPCALPATYTLVEGETLESVAMRFNLPLGSLLRVNPCLAPQDFEEGTTIILPR